MVNEKNCDAPNDAVTTQQHVEGADTRKLPSDEDKEDIGHLSENDEESILFTVAKLNRAAMVDEKSCDALNDAATTYAEGADTCKLPSDEDNEDIGHLSEDDQEAVATEGIPQEGATKANSKGTNEIPEDELEQLLELTNFSKREIIDFYTREDINDENNDGLIDRSEFANLCRKAGLRHESLINRLWKFFDSDDSSSITKFELVKGVAPLVRGTSRDIAGMFFDLYDVDRVS
jgi:Ca2+-binding EF-hand superfamily protein